MMKIMNYYDTAQYILDKARKLSTDFLKTVFFHQFDLFLYCANLSQKQNRKTELKRISAALSLQIHNKPKD